MNGRETIFIGVDLGTSMLRKSTGLAYLIEKNRKTLIEKPPEHMVSDDKKIRDYLTNLSGNSGSSIIGIDAPLSRPEHGTMRECERRLRKHGIPCYPSGAQWVSRWVDKGIELKKWAEKELDEIAGDRLLFDDELDAILSAYVAYGEGKGIAFKIDGGDSVIYVPMKRRNHTINEY